MRCAGLGLSLGGFTLKAEGGKSAHQVFFCTGQSTTCSHARKQTMRSGLCRTAA